MRKQAKHYTMTTDAAYDDVMLGCIHQHGEAWLYRGVRWLLRRLFREGYTGGANGAGTGGKLNVGVHSFELWDRDGQLVAGDLG